MVRRVVLPLLAAACAAAACTGEDGHTEQGTLLRVGTSHGLGEVIPGSSRVGGAAYYIRELLYEPISGFADVRGVEGRTVRLRPRGEDAAAVLEEALVFEGLEEVRPQANGELVVHFDSPRVAEAAAKAFRHGRPAIATGPFRLASLGNAVRLETSRRGTSIEAIEIQSLPTTELWRRLHGRDIDVIPILDEVHRDQFEGMLSVRTIDLPTPGHPSLIFNTRSEDVADPAVRRRIAATLDRSAIARIACGSTDCQVDPWISDQAALDEDRDVQLPSDLEILVLDSDSSLVLAAEVIRHQLRAAGVRVHLRRVRLSDMLAREARGYDARLAPIPSAAAAAAPYIDDVKLHPQRYEAARQSSEDASWALAFAVEMPAVPLYEGRFFAAIDGRFCGGEPDRASSWEWLAELHPCEVASR